MTQPRQQMVCKLCAVGPICSACGPDAMPGDPSHIVMRTRHLRKGDVLRVADSPNLGLHAVRSGVLKASAPLLNGAQNVVDFMVRGDVIGLDGMTEGAATDVIALARSSVCEIPLSRLDALCAQTSAAASSLRRLMSASLRRNQMWRVALAGFSATERVAMFLLDIATRSGCSGQLQMELALPMRRGDIGCYLGLREETVSRSLSALQVRQIITVNARVVTILNATALQTLIDKALDYRPVGES